MKGCQGRSGTCPTTPAGVRNCSDGSGIATAALNVFFVLVWLVLVAVLVREHKKLVPATA